MARIQVKDTVTGQKGSIEERELSSRYQPIQQLQQAQPKKSLAEGGFDLLTNLLVPSSRKTVEKLFRKEQVGGGDILRSALELGSFAIPFGKGANILSRAILPGAGVGLARGLSEEEATPSSVVSSTAGGAALSTAFPMVGKLLGLTGRGAVKAGENLALRALRPSPSQQRVFAEKTGIKSRQEIIAHYLPYILRQYAKGVPMRHMTRHLIGLYQGEVGARAWRRSLSEASQDDRQLIRAIRLLA